MVGKRRNFGLDVTRAVSILLVLISHKFTLDFEVGIFGVQIFFVLSGFLIGQILITSYNKKTFTFSGFWRRRWFRTLPLYYLILLLKVLLHGNPYGWKIIVYFLFLQANILGIDFFPVSWSLVVEEWFYLFLPFLFWGLYKYVPKKQHLGFLLLAIVSIFLFRYFYNLFERGNIIYQFDCLLLGVTLALLKISYPAVYFRLNNIYLFLLGGLTAVFLMVNMGQIDHVAVYSPYERVVWYFLVSLAITFTIPYLELSNFLNSRLSKQKMIFCVFTWISILTYALYLIHPEIYELKIVENNFCNTGLQMLLLFSVSYLVYALYEFPMTNLRDKFSITQYRQSIVKGFRLSTQ